MLEQVKSKIFSNCFKRVKPRENMIPRISNHVWPLYTIIKPSILIGQIEFHHSTLQDAPRIALWTLQQLQQYAAAGRCCLDGRIELIHKPLSVSYHSSYVIANVSTAVQMWLARRFHQTWWFQTSSFHSDISCCKWVELREKEQLDTLKLLRRHHLHDPG